jgi:hypothetical protein
MDPPKDLGEQNAEQLYALMAQLPEGVEMFTFMFTRVEGETADYCFVAGSCPPEEAIPVILKWMVRVATCVEPEEPRGPLQ